MVSKRSCSRRSQAYKNNSPTRAACLKVERSLSTRHKLNSAPDWSKKTKLLGLSNRAPQSWKRLSTQRFRNFKRGWWKRKRGRTNCNGGRKRKGPSCRNSLVQRNASSKSDSRRSIRQTPPPGNCRNALPASKPATARPKLLPVKRTAREKRWIARLPILKTTCKKRSRPWPNARQPLKTWRRLTRTRFKPWKPNSPSSGAPRRKKNTRRSSAAPRSWCASKRRRIRVGSAWGGRRKRAKPQRGGRKAENRRQCRGNQRSIAWRASRWSPTTERKTLLCRENLRRARAKRNVSTSLRIWWKKCRPKRALHFLLTSVGIGATSAGGSGGRKPSRSARLVRACIRNAISQLRFPAVPRKAIRALAV